MIVVFNSGFPEVEIIEFKRNKYKKIIFRKNEDELLKLYQKKKPDTFIYNFEFTADILKEPIQMLDETLIKNISQILSIAYEKLFPLYNIMNLFYKRFPSGKHFILSDTAFFSKLPDFVASYALPYEFKKKKIRRYGGFGLLHQWVFEKVGNVNKKKKERVISVYLGDLPNVCAIKEGKAIETSIGFTPVEGLPSIKTVGELDTQIIFFLYTCGLNLNEINEILTNQSGFSTILGEKCSFKDVIENKKSKEILKYHIIKHIGAYTGIMGGVDRIIFSGNKSEKILKFIKECCEEINFIGIKISDKIKEKGKILCFTEKNSKVEIYFMEADKIKMIKYFIKKIKEGKNGK